ncbi:MAG TPA: hypothetical protein VGK87_12855, partial [Anaerolineae bacterium]
MMMGLTSESYDRQYSDRQLWGRLSGYFSEYHRALAIVATLVLIITILGLLDPIIISRSLDALRTQPSQQTVWILFAYVMTSQTISFITNMIRRQYMARLIADVISKMRHEAFTASIQHDLSFFD